MEGKDLGLPGPNGASKPRQFHHLDAVGPAVEAIQGGAGGEHAVGGVDASEQLFALPSRDDLAGRIPGGQAGPQPHSSPIGELLGSREEQLADAVQRVTLAAPMPKGALLGPSADLIHHRVG